MDRVSRSPVRMSNPLIQKMLNANRLRGSFGLPVDSIARGYHIDSMLSIWYPLFFTEPMWCCAEPDVVLDGLLARLNQGSERKLHHIRLPLRFFPRCIVGQF